jgi:hypothetical protein
VTQPLDLNIPKLLFSRRLGPPSPQNPLLSADIKCWQGGSREGETSIPLRRVLANNGTSLAILDTKRIDRVKLAANEVGCGAQRLAERAEESLARPEREDEARVGVDNELLAL